MEEPLCIQLPPGKPIDTTERMKMALCEAGHPEIAEALWYCEYTPESGLYFSTWLKPNPSVDHPAWIKARQLVEGRLGNGGGRPAVSGDLGPKHRPQ